MNLTHGLLKHLADGIEAHLVEKVGEQAVEPHKVSPFYLDAMSNAVEALRELATFL